ncbi:hypothetical protein ECANGB1_385 [Enterospora canceri]|uniref:Uncharacterized protein n=1 Tax=Enterospora canceri TaxID=1081671 RepID=A0A1Y1S822_9MICR|nr:hypothetical protein ECANGB1_385 [Enterospora canceri]
MDSGDQFHTVAFKNQILKISSRGDYTLVFILNEAFDYDEIRQIADEIGGSEDVAEAIAKYAQE